jgi:flagellin
MSDINLTLSTRANLLSLQTTKSLLDRTSTRLSTGLKVSAPIDNAPAYFAAQALNFRASNFDTASANINQAVKALDSAISGLQAVTKLVQNAQGILTSMLTASSLSASDSLRSQYNSLLTQIDLLTNDASYQGINLINNGSQSLTLSFSNTPGVVDLSISAIRSDSAGLFLSSVAQGLFFALQTTIASQSSRDSIASIASTATVASRDSVAAVAALQSQSSITSFASVSSFGSQPSIASNATNGFSVPSQSSVPSFQSVPSIASRNSAAAVQQSVSAPSIQSTASVPSVGSASSQPSAAGTTVAGVNLSLVTATQLAVGQALSTLSANQATLGSTNAILAVRLQFTQSYVSTLQGGASLLTVADLNTEGANLTSLQTAQSLGVVSLQISTQSQQSILRLF